MLMLMTDRVTDHIMVTSDDGDTDHIQSGVISSMMFSTTSDSLLALVTMVATSTWRPNLL